MHGILKFVFKFSLGEYLSCVSGPDRDELDVRENIQLYNNSVNEYVSHYEYPPVNHVGGRIIEFQNKFAELVSQSNNLYQHLAQLTNQLGELSLEVQVK